MAEELLDCPDYSEINRAIPQLTSSKEKKEKCEHHLQKGICEKFIIPTPEVADIVDKSLYDKMYPSNYEKPQHLIHKNPITMEQNMPEYDLDSDDESWLELQTERLDLPSLKFEKMMETLENNISEQLVNLKDAKALLKEDDDLISEVFNYCQNKRLKAQHYLMTTVKTEERAGLDKNNPYVAFWRRSKGINTRSSRKKDETAYKKMLNLRKKLSQSVTSLEWLGKHEKVKREHVHRTLEIFVRRFEAKDFSGVMYAEEKN